MRCKTLTAAAAALLAATAHASATDDGNAKHRLHPRAKAMLERMDLDGDGAVGAAEFMGKALARSQEAFARMDADGDGKVSADEFRAAWAARTAEAFSKMDRNSDGRVTREDFRRMKPGIEARRGRNEASAPHEGKRLRRDRHHGHVHGRGPGSARSAAPTPADPQ